MEIHKQNVCNPLEFLKLQTTGVVLIVVYLCEDLKVKRYTVGSA